MTGMRMIILWVKPKTPKVQLKASIVWQEVVPGMIRLRFFAQRTGRMVPLMFGIML